MHRRPVYMDSTLQLHEVQRVPRDAAPSAATPNSADNPTLAATRADAAVPLNGPASPSATRWVSGTLSFLALCWALVSLNYPTDVGFNACLLRILVCVAPVCPVARSSQCGPSLL
jgi:hypothetical protein